MQFPKHLHAKGWHAHMPQLRMTLDSHDLRSPRERRRLHMAAAVIAFGVLMASAGVAAVDDPRPLDLQLSSALHRAGETLQQWQARLSHGLQVSLRAVADGNDRPAQPNRETTWVAEVASARGLQPTVATSSR